MSDAIEVTVTDPATGEVLGRKIIENDYLLICAGRVRLKGTTAYPTTGTHVLTIVGKS